MFLAEKGLLDGGGESAEGSVVELVEVDLRKGEHFEREFLARNPDGFLPCLELDDGRCISESVAICRYFEALHPEPPLFGGDAVAQGLVEMWTRRIEQQLYLPTQEFYRNGHPAFVGRGWPGSRGAGSGYEVQQVEGLVERSAAMFERTLGRLETQLEGTGAFVVGAEISMADIMLRTTLDFARRVRVPSAQELASHRALSAWYERMSERPSAGV